MELHLNASTDWSIEDQHGNTVTIAEAEVLIADGKVTDMNMAMERLAQNGFSLEDLQEYYAWADSP